MPNSQLSKLKSRIKTDTKVFLNLSSSAVVESNGETIFLNKLLLTNTQPSEIHEAFANCSSAIIKFSKTQFSKMMQFGIFKFLDKYRIWQEKKQMIKSV